MTGSVKKISHNQLEAFFVMTLVSFSIQSQAFSKAREHNHGVAELSIAADGKKIVVDFEAPADSIYGFEYAPKSDAEKDKQAQGLKKLKESISSIVSLDAGLKCTVAKGAVQAVQESSKHSEVKAGFEFICEKNVLGTKILLDFSAHFPALKKIRVQVVSGEKQQGLQIGQKGEVPL